MNTEQLGEFGLICVNPVTGNPAVYVKSITYNGHQITDADVDNVNVIKYQNAYYTKASADAVIAFDGNRPITRVSDLFGITPGGADVVSFLEKTFYPAIAPGAALLIGTPQREVGDSTAYTLSWTATKQTNPITGIVVDGQTIAPTGNTQSGIINGNVATAAGSYTKNMQVTAGTDIANASATLAYYFREFWGDFSAVPANSAQVRAISNNQLTVAGNQITLNTNTVNTNFAVYLPPGKNIVSVIDLDALNLNITAQYIASAITVNDAGGTPQAYTQYLMTQTVPYSTNHRHLITTN